MSMYELLTPESSQIEKFIFEETGKDPVSQLPIGDIMVKFKKGGLWQYGPAPKAVYDQVVEIHKAGSSVGKFFAARIKGIYPEKQLG